MSVRVQSYRVLSGSRTLGLEAAALLVVAGAAGASGWNCQQENKVGRHAGAREGFSGWDVRGVAALESIVAVSW